jgi:cytochrome oxidase Cu insertion factor (SCO1/SenC/PrrC family)
MNTRNAIALSIAAMLVSATAATAAPTHRHHVRHPAADARGAYAAAPAEVRAPMGQYYYEPSVGGSVWSYYPGYTDGQTVQPNRPASR